jgi:DNA-binding transcriptional regulator PaaX
MMDPITPRIMELQSQLRIRLAELGFGGIAGSNVVHHLAEIAALSRDLADEAIPLFMELSPAHKDALVNVVAHIKWDLDEIKDAIQDMEPDLTELMKFLQQK